MVVVVSGGNGGEREGCGGDAAEGENFPMT